MKNMLEIQNLSKSYKDFNLRDVSFTLPEGYIMGLIGPNGAGKTTIIKLVMSLLKKDAGRISIFGMDHRDHEVDIKSRIGFVYDNPNYYDHLSLRRIKNIIAPFYRTWDEGRFQQLVKQFNLPLNKALRKFSRGMVMKAAIAIALSHHADFIIMDEPTSGLDPIFRRELLDLLGEILQNEKKAVLFSTHITSDLEKIADYITLLINGRLVFSDTKDEVLAKFALVKGGRDIIGDIPLVGFKAHEYGFEGLTDNIQAVRKKYGSKVVLEKASLEDIMFYNNLGNNHAQFN
ncbi:ABC transporter ATP-binding protein [candidate division KSB1 bacterium]|nr:ABC transporter ATP-binding protein [candidate division KSB1 bacterium]